MTKKGWNLQSGVRSLIHSDHIVAQAVRYGAVGILNTLIGLSAIYTFMYFLGWDALFANFAGYMIALVNSFLLNRTWTFRVKVANLHMSLQFVFVFCIAYLSQFLFLVLLINIEINTYISQAAGVMIYVAVGFLGNKYLTFKE